MLRLDKATEPTVFCALKGLVAATCLIFALEAGALGQQPVTIHAVIPKPYRPKLADFKISASEIIPEMESAQNFIFSDSISAMPVGEGINEIVAPPITTSLHQQIGIRYIATGQSYINGRASKDLELAGRPDAIWIPGQWIASMHSKFLSLAVHQTALSKPQGIVEEIVVKNESSTIREVELFSIEQPSIVRPQNWGYGRIVTPSQSANTCTLEDDVLAYANRNGAVTIAAYRMSASGFDSSEAATLGALRGEGLSGRSNEKCVASAASWKSKLNPHASATVDLVITIASDPKVAVADAKAVLVDAAGTARGAASAMQMDLDRRFEKLPMLESLSDALVRFYHHTAVQLFYDRWRLGKTFVFDPWYPVSGRDSGGMNLYAWDIQYAAQTFTFLDSSSLRKILLALPAAPLTEHYAINPVRGEGQGPFYAFNPYAYTNSVDQYLTATGDGSLLRERVAGKTIMDWLITLAQWGEQDRDPDRNDLLDYGTDLNLLELKKTGNGSGYLNEVPSHNGQRVYVYQTVADLMKSTDSQLYRDQILHFREMAARVSRALNRALWLDKDGWYGTRQRDGSVIPVYTVQVLELLRFPGLVPRDRAGKLVEHLNDQEFVGPWGIRSMSIKDRLYDFNDHDWAGAMSYAGTGPELSADLFSADYPEQEWMSLKKIFWWPDHLAVYPQGIANDSYTSLYPQAARFGGRISGGHNNIIVGCAGVDAVVRGVFGVELGRDGSIKVSNNQLSDRQSSALTIPFRGQMWTVTQAPDGLDLRSDNGFDVSFFRHDGSICLKTDGSSIAIALSSRMAGSSHVNLLLAPLLQIPGAQDKDRLLFRVQDKCVTPRYEGGVAIISTQTALDQWSEVEVTTKCSK